MSPAAAAHPELPQHVVTAVLVSHDGERWLPDVLAGLVNQRRPVQDVIAADTGSADRSADMVTDALGADRVLHLARRTSFATAVAEAAKTAPVLTPDDLSYLRRPSGWDPATRTWRDDNYDMPELPFGEPVHWLWLLHDDSAPEPDTLAQLLRQAEADPGAVILGAKLRGWYDRRQLLEAGVSIAPSGRRWTGIDRREQDQGQHDQRRAALSVSTAGMLIRRDVFERLGGFDRRLPLMRDDVDLCWRAHLAGHRVRIVPDAVLRHAEASARERRSIDCAGRLGGSPHRVDKAAAVYTLLANTRSRLLPWVILRLVLGTVLRVLAYLLGKQPGRAVDEVAGLLATVLRPGRLLKARQQRRHTTIADLDHSALRPLFPPPGATVKATAEQAIGAISRRTESGPAGRHGSGGVESGPTDDEADSLQVEQFARVRQLVRKPGPVLFLGLLLAAAVACRGLFSSGALSGGALLPAPAEAAGLWARYLDSWQPVATGGVEGAPPYLALLALLATPLLGSTGLAMTLLLLCAVPLAGASAYFSSKSLIPSRLLRAWGAIAYAFLPALTGAIASGRLGTVVLAILLPVLARCAVLAAGLLSDGRGPWRAAWAGALLLTVVTAFTPIIWALAAVLALVALARPGVRQRGALANRLAALVLTPVLMLAPWSLTVLTSPSRLLREAGLPYDTEPAGALELLGLNPGGPGTPAGLLLLGVLVAALAALLRRDRRRAIVTAWAAALAALLFAVWANGSAWAGPAVQVYALALIAAALLGADGARGRVAAENFGWRQPVAVLVAAATALGTVLVAGSWMVRGAEGPLQRANPVQVPAFVAEESSTSDQARTLVLAGDGESADGSLERLDYALVRGSGARLGDADLAALMSEDSSLRAIVADLAAGSGADQAERLSGYAIRYVLVRDGSPAELHRVLDTTTGLQRLSQEDGSALWRVERELSRVMLLPPEGAPGGPQRVAAGPVEVDTEIPEGPEGRVLRIADSFAGGWQATLDGSPLTPVRLDGWAQGFEVPASGGRLQVVHEPGRTHTLWVWAQGFGLLVLTVMALPGRRRELDDDLPDEDAEELPDELPRQGDPADDAGSAEADPERAREREPEPAAAGAGAAPGAGGPVPGQRPAPPDQPAAPVPAQQEWDGTGYPPQDAYGQPEPGPGFEGYDYQPAAGYQPEFGSAEYGTGEYPAPEYRPEGYPAQPGYPQQGYPQGEYPQGGYQHGEYDYRSAGGGEFGGQDPYRDQDYGGQWGEERQGQAPYPPYEYRGPAEYPQEGQQSYGDGNGQR